MTNVIGLIGWESSRVLLIWTFCQWGAAETQSAQLYSRDLHMSAGTANFNQLPSPPSLSVCALRNKLRKTLFGGLIMMTVTKL